MTALTAGKLIYWAAILAEMAIRAPWSRRRRGQVVRERHFDAGEAVSLGLLWLGMFVLPLVYSLTGWLDFADYALPAWTVWLGAVLIAAAVGVFWRAHRDLAENWSPTLELREGHELITRGIYGVVRHPMYASQWLWVLAQPLLLPNWVAGVLNLVLWVPFYLVRSRREERMMVDAFGEAYVRYRERVGGVIPRPGGGRVAEPPSG